MNLEKLKQKYYRVIELLRNGNLPAAMTSVKEMASEENNYKAIEEIDRAKQTYDYMLYYFVEGMSDPSRKDVYDSTVEKMRLIAEGILNDKLIEESTDLLYSSARICRHRNLTPSKLFGQLSETEAKLLLAKSAENSVEQIANDKDAILKDIFNFVWSARFNENIKNEILGCVNSTGLSASIINYLIAALSLSLLGNYDRFKIETLLYIYENCEDESIAASALTGLMLSLRRHADRVRCDRHLIARLKMWEDSVVTYSRLRDVARAIIRTRDTDRVTAKMRDEVMPELMKLRPDMLKKLRESGSDIEASIMENNPEWEEMLENSGIADKMRELTEMQSEGADLLMITFANLKGFPFFYNPGAWFMPFDIENPAIHVPLEMKDKIDSVLSIGKGMCDADKYSLVLAFSSMPDQQRQIMLNQFDMQLSQLSEEMKAELENKSRPEFNEATTLFVRQFYRFFKLFRKKEEFEDPFISPFNFLDIPVIGDMLSDEEMLRVTAEFYFKRGYHAEALALFKTLEDSEKDLYDYWEKVGFSLQNLKRYSEALDAYHKAELLKDPGEWLIKKLAFLSRKTGDFKAAAAYYERLLESSPDDPQTIMHLGYSRQESGDIQGALHAYYHANYVDPSNPSVWRAIGWGELINGNPEKSLQYYSRLIEDSSVGTLPADFLNAGHAQLLGGNYKGALDYYRKSSDGNFKEFEEAFLEDEETLISLGIPELSITLILDKLRLESDGHK